MRLNLFPAWAIALALAASGCVSESADIGRPPPVVLATPRSDLELPRPSPRGASVRGEIAKALADIGHGDAQAVRVRIFARSTRDAEALRRMLIGLGADPARLSSEVGGPSSPRLVFTRTVSVLAPCAAAISPVAPDDPLPSLMSLAHCNQDNNLAQMLVDPGDLVSPPRLAPEDAAYLESGVEAWRGGRAAPSAQPQAGVGGSGATASGGTSTAGP